MWRRGILTALQGAAGAVCQRSPPKNSQEARCARRKKERKKRGCNSARTRSWPAKPFLWRKLLFSATTAWRWLCREISFFLIDFSSTFPRVNGRGRPGLAWLHRATARSHEKRRQAQDQAHAFLAQYDPAISIRRLIPDYLKGVRGSSPRNHMLNEHSEADEKSYLI